MQASNPWKKSFTPRIGFSKNTMLAWAKLLRIALAPTAVADVAAGIVLGARGWPPGSSFVFLLLASLSVYHGAMALNDWSDRDWDAKTRSDRPIPAGSISARKALSVALLLLGLAPLLAFFAVHERAAEPTSIACVVATSLSVLFAMAYDLGPRGPLLGPLLLATCRALNLASGVFFGLAFTAGSSTVPDLTSLLVISAYGSFVFIVSRLGRMEDGESAQSLERLPARYCRRLAVLLGGVGALACIRAIFQAGELPTWEALLPLVIGVAGARALWIHSRRDHWEQSHVMQAMGCALRRFLVLTSCAALLVPGTPPRLVALLILCGFPLSYWLRKVAPPS